MKFLLVVVVIAGAAFFAWPYFSSPKIEREHPAPAKVEEATPAPAPEPEPAPPVAATPPAPVTPEPEPAAPAPPKKNLAPEGVYYTLQRISVMTDSGAFGVEPGTKVTVANPGPPMRVTDGKHEFEAAASMLTNDLDVAGQVYQLNTQQRAAMAAAQESQIQDAQAREADRNAANAAFVEAANKKRELDAQLQKEQMRRQAQEAAAQAQATAAQTKPADTAVSRVTKPAPTPKKR